MCCSHDSDEDYEGCDINVKTFVVILVSPFFWFQKKKFKLNHVLFTDVFAVTSHSGVRTPGVHDF